MSGPRTFEVVGEIVDEHPAFYEILDDLNGKLEDTKYRFQTAHGPRESLLVVESDDE